MKPSAARNAFLFLLALAGAVRAAPLPPGFAAQLDAAYPAVEALYLDLHRNPELGMNEHRTAAKLAERVRALGYEVTTGVGGTGVVAVMRNGPGPTVMLRTEMDALPVLEKTGLPYASKATASNPDGQTVPVMHACGHDLHMAAWYGTAKIMADNRKDWQGTLLLVGQPAEETLQGAAAMIRDGLFTRFPKPDYALSLHDEPSIPSGQIAYRTGYFRAGIDTLAITVYGSGGHGAAPQFSRDPVVMAARLVMALQTVVSRENDPTEPVVITVGSIHGGTKANIVPDEVKLQASVRTVNDAARKRVLDAITRVANGVALAGDAPKPPLIEVTESGGAVYNDPALTERAANVARAVLGAQNVVDLPFRMTSEDFTMYAREGVKSAILHFGAVDRARLEAARAAGKTLPVPHSPLWAPDYGPAVRTAITVESAVLLDLLGKRRN